MQSDDDRERAIGRLVLALFELLAPRVQQPEPPSTSAMAPPLISKQSLATHLGISTAGVDRLVRAGKIPHVLVGDVRRFDLAAVRAALESSATPPAVPQLPDGAPVRLVRGRR